MAGQCSFPRPCMVLSFSDRNLHSKMSLLSTPARLTLLHACDQWHSSRASTFLPGDTVNCVQTLKVHRTLLTHRVTLCVVTTTLPWGNNSTTSRSNNNLSGLHQTYVPPRTAPCHPAQSPATFARPLCHPYPTTPRANPYQPVPLWYGAAHSARIGRAHGKHCSLLYCYLHKRSFLTTTTTTTTTATTTTAATTTATVPHR
jgi:hypothetical protein